MKRRWNTFQAIAFLILLIIVPTDVTRADSFGCSTQNWNQSFSNTQTSNSAEVEIFKSSQEFYESFEKNLQEYDPKYSLSESQELQVGALTRSVCMIENNGESSSIAVLLVKMGKSVIMVNIQALDGSETAWNTMSDALWALFFTCNPSFNGDSDDLFMFFAELLCDDLSSSGMEYNGKIYMRYDGAEGIPTFSVRSAKLPMETVDTNSKTNNMNGKTNSTYMSDRYPKTDEKLKVFHNIWHTGKWDKSKTPCRLEDSFHIGDNTYLKGIGLYIEGESFQSSIKGTKATGMVQYRVNSEYQELIFDLGPDNSSSKYCGSDDGTANVQIFCDDKMVYESGFFDYQGFFPDQHVYIDGASWIKIVVTVEKGSNNTLNVVLGNPVLR